MQLLKITTTPMKYEFEVENPKLKYQQDLIPSGDISTTDSQLSIDTKNAEIKIDTYQARKSLGLLNIDDSIRQYSEKGKEHITKLIQEYVQIGKQLGDIQDGVDIGDVIRQKIIETPILYTTTLPSAEADISCEPAEADISFQPGDVSVDWQIKDTSYVFQPGSFHMKIVEYPKIDIEYLGGPMYVPPSANPNYNETAE
ncbi:MAG: DUF6470 family protein [Oscillospiraceae bacterium]|nr:DUF6470 family protein [Oscillospiraceae bacterium]